jgi:hypothetical protein
MAANLGLSVLRRPLLFNARPQPCMSWALKSPHLRLPVRVASSVIPSHAHYTTSKSFILTFTRGLRSALERTPVRRIARPPRSPFDDGSGEGFLNHWKRRINRMNPDHIFYAILGINGVVFLMWGWAQENFVGINVWH